MTQTLPPLTLILGTAASGKSQFGEELILRTGCGERSGRDPIYIATAEVRDEEMEQKVLSHRRQRGRGWQTVEAPRHLRDPLRGAVPGDVILLDCATMWLSNLMLAEEDTDGAITDLLLDIKACRARVVIISNELGGGIVPDNKLARRFQNTHGKMNQRLAAAADAVALVTAGLPLWLKGRG